tara:strand:+ start:642 stop:743 length:102 start_codon:yes stop_codon:yes gene_type:complete
MGRYSTRVIAKEEFNSITETIDKSRIRLRRRIR